VETGEIMLAKVLVVRVSPLRFAETVG
jgi:hypothetical protein